MVPQRLRYCAVYIVSLGLGLSVAMHLDVHLYLYLQGAQAVALRGKGDAPGRAHSPADASYDEEAREFHEAVRQRGREFDSNSNSKQRQMRSPMQQPKDSAATTTEQEQAKKQRDPTTVTDPAGMSSVNSDASIYSSAPTLMEGITPVQQRRADAVEATTSDND